MSDGAIKLASDIHNELLHLISPVTPDSIVASSLAPSRNPALFTICVAAFASFLVFSIPVLIPLFYRTAIFSPQQSELFQIIGGAGLGSAFYALNTASSYITARTFDRKYGNTYLIRFGLGLLSGLILAYFLRDLLQVHGASGGSSGGSPPSGLQNVGVGAVALLGGYAAQAVAQILDRVSETLVVFVSGSDKDKLDAARQKADADAEKRTTQALNSAARKLQLAAGEGDPGAGIQKVIGDLLSRK